LVTEPTILAVVERPLKTSFAMLAGLLSAPRHSQDAEELFSSRLEAIAPTGTQARAESGIAVVMRQTRSGQNAPQRLYPR